MIGAPRFGALGLAMMPVKALDTVQPIYGLVGAALLAMFLVRGEFGALLPASALMLSKIALDLANLAYSLEAYRRWTGERRPPEPLARPYLPGSGAVQLPEFCAISAPPGAGYRFSPAPLIWGRSLQDVHAPAIVGAPAPIEPNLAAPGPGAA